jgi:hypothetical protein
MQRCLLCGASAVVINLSFTPAQATGLPPGVSLSIEGGAVCDLDDKGAFSTAYTYSGVTAFDQTRFGDVGCGWTGRIGLTQERPGQVLGVADFWGVFVRHQDFETDRFRTSDSASEGGIPKYYFAGINSGGTFEEDRTVVDFEVGKDLGIGSPRPKLRIFGGLRYAHYSSELAATGKTEGVGCSIISGCDYYDGRFSFSSKHTFDGVGPRLGLTGQLPLVSRLFITGTISGSVLWGDHSVRMIAAGPSANHRVSSSDDDVVTNAEGEVGLGWFFMPNGTKLVVGARWEGWFDQSEFKSYSLKLDEDSTKVSARGSLDRNNWGPFLRFSIPLGPPPPP